MVINTLRSNASVNFMCACPTKLFACLSKLSANLYGYAEAWAPHMSPHGPSQFDLIH